MAALEAYPEVDIIGMNCATGPQEMGEHVRYLARNCSRKLSVMPNAGLPQLVDGKTHYPLSPAELARMAEANSSRGGVNIVGGCCGTTPEHLAAVVRAAVGRQSESKPKSRSPAHCAARASRAVSIALSAPCRCARTTRFLIVAERTQHQRLAEVQGAAAGGRLGRLVTWRASR